MPEIWFPPHSALTLDHNAHLQTYMTTAEAVDEIPGPFWVSAAQRDAALAEGSIWVARWVPDGSEGLRVRAAAHLDALVEEMMTLWARHVQGVR